jgi:serine/threonine protein kinase
MTFREFYGIFPCVIDWTFGKIRTKVVVGLALDSGSRTPGYPIRHTTMNWLREADAEPISGFRLIAPLGSGGFGEVWKCLGPNHTLKAIKFLYTALNNDGGEAARVEKQRKSLHRIRDVRHPLLITIERIDVVGCEIAFVMELAERNLNEILIECQSRGQAGIPRDELIRYLLDVAEGVDHLNEKHDVHHLNIKPSNLFLTNGRVKVSDYGLVNALDRQGSAGLPGGMSPVYAAPETFTGRVFRQSDQFSLATVYCELLMDRRPFSGKNVRQLAVQKMSDLPDLSFLAEPDRVIVGKALARDPSKRFDSCAEFVDALAQAAVQAEFAINETDDHADVGRSPERLTHDDDQLTAQISLEPDPNPEDPVTTVHRKVATYRLEGEDPAIANSESIWGAEAEPSTRSAKQSRSASYSDADAEVDLGGSHISATVKHEHTATSVSRGVLRPTIFLGIGSFGLRSLTDIRCRLLDRFGDLSQIPAYRYLLLDSDSATLESASLGSPDVALGIGETFALPLQPVINYRRRMIDHLNAWLPKEKLHSMPRSLHPQGSRALGRLAFVDNFPRIQSRLRREIQIASLPDSLELSTTQTGLSRGRAAPRVFVFASGSGGSSGMIPDFGYVLRRLLRQLNYPDASVTLYAFCGSPSDSNTARHELANVYATLVELNHFRQPDMAYNADFGPDGPRVTDPGSPFDSVYLLAARERTPEAVRDTIAHLATFVTQDVSSILGPSLERDRRSAFGEKTTFRSFGTFTSWFPRGLLLRVAARRAVARLTDVWQATVLPKTVEIIDQICSAALADPGLRWESISAELNRRAVVAKVGTPIEATERMLEQIEKEASGPVANEHAGTWAVQVSERVRQWAGPGTGRELESRWKKSQFNSALTQACQQLGEEWDEYLAEQLRDLIRGPGHRLATAETGIRRLIAFCDKAIAVQWEAIERHYQGMKRRIEELELARQACQGGVMRLFGAGRNIRSFVEAIRQFARNRIAQDLLEAGVQFFMTLRGRLEDRIRDFGFARQRLKHLRQALIASANGTPTERPLGIEPHTGFEIRDPFWDAVQGSATVRIVLPAGVTDLEQSAEQFTNSLRPEHWLALDEWLQTEALAPMGDLHLAAAVGSDVANCLGRPLIEQAATYLGRILPITDVAQVEFSAAEAQNERLDRRIASYAAAAEPLIIDLVKDEAYVLVPETDAGMAFTRAAVEADPDMAIVPVPTPIEMTVLREQRALSDATLVEFFAEARDVYQEVAGMPALSPHARFDVGVWKPIGRDKAAVA